MSKLPHTIESAKAALTNKELTAVELTQATLKNIEAWQPHVHSYLQIFAGDALKQAEESDKKIAAGVEMFGVWGMSGLVIFFKSRVSSADFTP